MNGTAYRRETMKTFSDDIEAVGAIDWEGMDTQPLEYVALAVKQAMQAMDGAEESVFHNRMRVLRVARKLETWKLDLDPDVDRPFVDPKRWVKHLWPKSYRYCAEAWETEEELGEFPMNVLQDITGANLKVLRQVSSGVRGKVLNAAREMTKDQFEAHLSEKYDQHIEPIQVMPKVSAVKFEEAVTMVETVEECNRAEALEKIAELIICEYAVAYEHKEHTA
jgi:hypothetical protein